MRKPLFVSFVLAACVFSTAARADDLDKAKMYFNAGAQAYTAGQFAPAIAAFEEAYRLAPRPPILFSLAQAQRKQYFVDHKPYLLEKAVENFRKYVEQVPQGGRRADAVQALSELEPVLEQMKAAKVNMAEEKPAKLPARVMVTSPTPGATVAIDAGKPGEAPLVAEVPAGKHTIVVSAKGFAPETRAVQVVDGAVEVLDLPLAELPALLMVHAPAGADIVVDGRPLGVAPLSAPLQVGHGHHFVAVLENGTRAYTTEIDAVRGQTVTMDAQLSTSSQRIAAYVVLGAGVAGLVTGGVFTGLSLKNESNAKSILDARGAGNIDAGQLADYDSARNARDRDRTVALTAFGVGGALVVTSVLLMTFDRPVVANAPAPESKSPSAPQKPTTLPMDMAAAPMFGAGYAGVAMSLVF